MLYQTTLFRERCKSGIIYLNGWMSHMTLHLKGHFNVLIFNPPPSNLQKPFPELPGGGKSVSPGGPSSSSSSSFSSSSSLSSTGRALNSYKYNQFRKMYKRRRKQGNNLMDQNWVGEIPKSFHFLSFKDSKNFAHKIINFFLKRANSYLYLKQI